jgi:hypothetical protein
MSPDIYSCERKNSINKYTRVRVYVCLRIYVQTPHLCACVGGFYMCMCVCMYVCMCDRVCSFKAGTYGCKYAYVYVYMYVCVCVCM